MFIQCKKRSLFLLPAYGLPLLRGEHHRQACATTSCHCISCCVHRAKFSYRPAIFRGFRAFIRCLRAIARPFRAILCGRPANHSCLRVRHTGLRAKQNCHRVRFSCRPAIFRGFRVILRPFRGLCGDEGVVIENQCDLIINSS